MHLTFCLDLRSYRVLMNPCAIQKVVCKPQHETSIWYKNGENSISQRTLYDTNTIQLIWNLIKKLMIECKS